MRIRALMLRIVRQFRRDKRSLALMFIAPMLILFLMSLVFQGEPFKPAIALDSSVPAAVETRLLERGAAVDRDAASAPERLRDGRLDAYLQLEDGRPKLTIEGSDPNVSRAVVTLLQSVLQSVRPEAENAPAPQAPEVEYVYGDADLAPFDSFGPVLIGVFAFFFVFLMAGVAFLRERTGGTLERLLASPIRRWEIVAGYIGGFGLFTVLQACLIAAFAIAVLDMRMAGSFGYVLLITILLSITALSLGVLLSSFANNEFQMIQFIPLVIVPQIFFSGLFNLDTISDWLSWIHWGMPLYYGADALRDVMVRGLGWSAIARDVFVLLGFSFAFMLLNVAALRKHRKL
ncbi:ABC transporter permease [Paenibacillus thermoaerophilus]|uniref:ABC transporter permease n=1 Tax=Paenibacillus thermoaerophilus TaxID=1215385 RepID=A0ABW2V1B3_9BACL|nr:ABC transporter permease [Paenibacillus thermoaerophilus]TMV18482.1 ABC transporter permease [Paenibacillus thermoaerophilus]